MKDSTVFGIAVVPTSLPTAKQQVQDQYEERATGYDPHDNAPDTISVYRLVIMYVIGR